jgi:elongation factor Ts
MADVDTIKELRDQTGLSLGQISKALKESGGDKAKALELLASQAGEQAAKKGNREVKDGVIGSYIHSTGKRGAMIGLACETDFVARNDSFKDLARELAMHATAMGSASVQEMLAQPFVKDPNITVQELINQAIAKLGENIRLVELAVMAIG